MGFDAKAIMINHNLLFLLIQYEQPSKLLGFSGLYNSLRDGVGRIPYFQLQGLRSDFVSFSEYWIFKFSLALFFD